MDEALNMGINFFDTADDYGAGLEDRGGAEKIIGRWLAQGGGRRDAVIIAAKVFGHCAAFYDRYEENSATDGLSRYKILKRCEGTLKHLQTDHLEMNSEYDNPRYEKIISDMKRELKKLMVEYQLG